MFSLTAVPNVIDAAALDLSAIGAAVDVAGAAAALRTTTLPAAAEDEVSAVVAATFAGYGRQFQVLSEQAAAFHGQFLRVVAASVGAYAGAEAANAQLLNGLQQAIAQLLEPPARALSGRPPINDDPRAPSRSAATTPTATDPAIERPTPNLGAAASPSPLAGQSPVTATIPVGQAPGSTVLSPDQRFLYVTNQTVSGERYISVINTATKAVVSVPMSGIFVNQLVMSPTGTEVYVAGQLVSGGTASDVIVPITTATNIAGAPIVIGSSYNGSPGSIAITPDGSRIYAVTHVGNGVAVPDTVAVIDTASHSVTGSIDYGATNLAVTPTGGRVYATGVGSIAAISTASNTVTAALPSPSPKLDLLLSPDGSHAYVQDTTGIDIVDTATNTFHGRISPTEAYPNYSLRSGLAASPDGQYLFVPSVSAGGDAALFVFDTQTGGIGSPIALQSGIASPVIPLTVVVSPNGQYVYTAGPQNGNIIVIDTVNAAISDPIQINPYGLLGGIAATDSTAYVADGYSSSVALINPAAASFRPLPSGTGFTGTTTPVVVIPPPTGTPPGSSPPGYAPLSPPPFGLPVFGFPSFGLPAFPGLDLSGIFNADLSHSLDPLTNALKWGSDLWTVGNALLGNGSFGPLALGSAVLDARSLGVNLANQNWGGAAIDVVSIAADLVRTFI